MAIYLNLKVLLVQTACFCVVANAFLTSPLRFEAGPFFLSNKKHTAIATGRLPSPSLAFQTQKQQQVDQDVGIVVPLPTSPIQISADLNAPNNNDYAAITKDDFHDDIVVPTARQEMPERKILIPSTATTKSVNSKPVTTPKTMLTTSTKMNSLVTEPQLGPSDLHNRSTRPYKRLSGWLRQKTTIIAKKWKVWTKSLRQRPGTQFRVRLGLVVMTFLSAITLLGPSSFAPNLRLANVRRLVQQWLSNRGFQGIAAFGRSVAYGWALFVGYPRMLDKRASEAKRKEYEKQVEQRRIYLQSLTTEISRLRQELANIDSEIRSFRREIIAMKVYERKNSNNCNNGESNNNNDFTKDTNSDIQDAINAEMAHLARLRSDTQAALSAARQTWAEARSKSPTEAWDIQDLTT